MAICIFSIHANAQKTKQETGKVTPESLESWVPVPIISAGATNTDAPSDAIVLFNGKDEPVRGHNTPSRFLCHVYSFN